METKQEKKRRQTRESMRRWRERNPEKAREKSTEFARKWRKADPERAKRESRKASRIRRERYPEEVKACNRERMRRAYDPAKRKLRAEALRKWYSEGDVTRQELIYIYETHNERCHYCGEAIGKMSFNPSHPIGFDHKLARVNGGEHTASNIVPCCKECNWSKGVRDYDEFIKNGRIVY